MNHTWSRWLTRLELLFGAFLLLGAGLWCIGGAGIYGSPLAGMSRSDFEKICAYLLVGPMSVLPATIVASRHPLWGGAWLIFGGILSGFITLVIIPDPILRGKMNFETLAPLLIVSLPMLLLGARQIHVARSQKRRAA